MSAQSLPSLPLTRRSRFLGDPIAECTWPLELFTLLVDPVWRGGGVPRGDGAPVLLVPGFLGGDASLLLLHNWLRRIGYRSHRADIVWNVNCADRAVRQLAVRLEQVAARAERAVTVIGHSAGGLFGRALAARAPQLIAQVITLGSPLTDQYACAPLTALWLAGARAMHHTLSREAHTLSREAHRDDCVTADCCCAVTEDLITPLPQRISLTSIYTPDDGIVRPTACRTPGASPYGAAISA